jgi:aspartyl-tRNA synthetase
MERTHHCGELRPEHIETHVTLCGWARTVRDQSHQLFVDLRDRSGTVQCVVDLDLNPETFAKLSGHVKTECCLLLRGTVKKRLEGKENAKIATGDIEVHVQSGEILNTCKPLPFELAENIRTEENTRIQYRYLDLRRERMRDNLHLRYKTTRVVREFLDSEGFWEIETPLLWKSTPEGAREFLVPSTTHAGQGFVLPQSPQISKQLLMVGGVEKYFQIARCFRDETARADRFLEFTQIDLEMSFVGQEDVLDVWERMFQRILRDVKGIELQLPLPRLTYEEAQRRYGSDKPDTRYGMELVDLTDLAPQTNFKVFQNAVASGGQVKAICAKGCAEYSRKEIDDLTELVKRFGARGLATFAIGENEVKSPVAKFFTPEQMAEIFARCEAGPGDLVMCVADARGVVAQSLDFLRREMARRLNLVPPGTFDFVWIVDTPMFEYDKDGDRFDAMHHPFCLPNPNDMPLLEAGFSSPLPKSDPEHPHARIRSWLYDLVLNGLEISSGSIRCHRRDIQEQIFDAIGLSKEEAASRFGFMLDAFEYGAPPHGGVACGFDRLVTILAELPDGNMRDMVAFPKTTSGTDPLSGAPTPLDPKRIHELGLQVLADEKSETAGTEL